MEMITKLAIKQGLTTEEVVFVNNRICYLMDISITQTIIEREKISSKKIKENKKVIIELSSPIVPIQNGTAILPLVGEFDCDKSNHILNNVIPKIRDLDINCLIIDFSGLVNINDEVASRIFNIYDTLILLGVNTIYTGIRPDLATRIVNAGIDFSSLKIFATVQQALTQ
jgi:rsbT co-antagonist protein RsbR